jgi:hypothetical protein
MDYLPQISLILVPMTLLAAKWINFAARALDGAARQGSLLQHRDLLRPLKPESFLIQILCLGVRVACRNVS